MPIHKPKQFRFLLLLSRHSAKSLIAQDERMATPSWWIIMLHLHHAVEVKLHTHYVDVVILIQETVDLDLVFEQ